MTDIQKWYKLRFRVESDRVFFNSMAACEFNSKLSSKMAQLMQERDLKQVAWLKDPKIKGVVTDFSLAPDGRWVVHFDGKDTAGTAWADDLLFPVPMKDDTEEVYVSGPPSKYQPRLSDSETEYLLCVPETYIALADYHEIQLTQASAMGLDSSVLHHERRKAGWRDYQAYVTARTENGEDVMFKPSRSEEDDGKHVSDSVQDTQDESEYWALNRDLTGQTHVILLNHHMKGLVIPIPSNIHPDDNPDLADVLSHSLNIAHGARFNAVGIVTLPDFRVRKCKFGTTRGFIEAFTKLVRHGYEQGDYSQGLTVVSETNTRRGYVARGVAFPGYLLDPEGNLRPGYDTTTNEQ